MGLAEALSSDGWGLLETVDPGPLSVAPLRTAPIDVRPGERTHLDVAKRSWVSDVCSMTGEFRRSRAALMELSHPGSDWHRDRARGLRLREERAVGCGVDGVDTHCGECGTVGPVRRKTCGDWRLCHPCAARRADRHVARFTQGREQSLARLKHRMRARVKGGRWAESFYTLTLPHRGFEADYQLLKRAWPLFRRALRHYLEARGSAWKDVPFQRAVEVTSSGGGHWHIHVWSVLPYVPQWALAHMWGSALKSADRSVTVLLAGLPDVAPGTRDAEALAYFGVDSLWAPVVDVRAATSAAGEICKYMVKSIERGALVSPVWYSLVYRVLEGSRSHESSRKFLVRAKQTQGFHPAVLASSDRYAAPFCGCGLCLPLSSQARGYYLSEAPLGPPS